MSGCATAACESKPSGTPRSEADVHMRGTPACGAYGDAEIADLMLYTSISRSTAMEERPGHLKPLYHFV